jgi:hypothetical protein
LITGCFELFFIAVEIKNIMRVEGLQRAYIGQEIKGCRFGFQIVSLFAERRTQSAAGFGDLK